MSRFYDQNAEIGFLRYAHESISASCGDMHSFTRPKQGIDRIFNQINDNFERGLIKDKTYFLKRFLSGALAQEGQAPYLHPLLHACSVGNFVAISAIFKNIKQLNNPEINEFVINSLLDHVFILRNNNIYNIRNSASSAFGELLKSPERLACFEEFLKGAREIFNDDARFQNYFKSFFTENYNTQNPLLRTYDNLSVNLNNILSEFGVGSSHGKLLRESDITRMQAQEPVQEGRQEPVQPQIHAVAQVAPEPAPTHAQENLALAISRNIFTSNSPGIVEISDAEAAQILGAPIHTTPIVSPNETNALVRRRRDPMNDAEAQAMRDSVRRMIEARKQADLERQEREQAREQERLERLEWQKKLREEKEELERQSRLTVAVRGSTESSLVATSQNSQRKNTRNHRLATNLAMLTDADPLPARPSPRQRGRGALGWVDHAPVQVPTRDAVIVNAENQNDNAFIFTTFENALKKFKEKNTYASIISTPSSAASVASIDLYKELETFAKFVTGQANHGFVNLNANKFFRPNYDEFAEILKYWNYRLDPSFKDKNLEKLSEENHKMISQFIYFLSTNQAVPLWLMQELDKERPARTEETFKTILSRIPSRTSLLIASQLPENPSLQDLINGGATFDAIQKYVKENDEENDEEKFKITSLKGIITHPQYKEILDFLTQNRADKKPLLSYETHAGAINEALTHANEIGAFNFFAYKQEWCSKWAQTKETTQALKTLYSPDAFLNQDQERFLVNLLKASQKIKFAIKPISSVAKGHDADDSAAVRAIATYLTSSLLTSQNSPSSEEIAYLLDRVSKLTDANAREEILLRTIKNVALASGAVLASLIEGLQAKKFMTKKITASLFDAPFHDHTTLKAVAMSLAENALHELAHKKDAANFMKLMKFVKSAGPSHVNYVLKFRPNQKKGLPQSISENIPEIFPEFYDLYLKNLDKDGKEEIYNQGEELRLPADLTQTVKCDHNLLFEGVKSSLGDVAFLKKFLLDVQDNLDPITFYLQLTAVRVGERKNAQELILEHFKYDEKNRAEFEDYFSDIEEEMMIFRDGKQALDNFSARFLPTFSKELRRGDHLQDIIDQVHGQSAKKYAENYYRNKTNVVSRFVHYLNNINEFNYPTAEIKGFKPDVLEEIIYPLLSFDGTNHDSFKSLKGRGFQSAKKKSELLKEQELATKLVACSLQGAGATIPLFLQQEIIELAKSKSPDKSKDKTYYLQTGFALIAESVKNPKIRAILEGKREEIPLAKAAKLPKNPTIEQLVIAGADLSAFEEYYKGKDGTKNAKKTLDYIDLEVLLRHPQATEIKNLIFDNHEKRQAAPFETVLFGHAIALGYSKFLEDNSLTMHRSIANTTALDRDLVSARDFAQQKALLPFYGTLIKTPRTSQLSFCQTKSLFSNLTEAAIFYRSPEEFFEYLKKVELYTSTSAQRGQENEFVKLLKYENTQGDGLFELVKNTYGLAQLVSLEEIYRGQRLENCYNEKLIKHREVAPSQAVALAGAAPAQQQNEQARAAAVSGN